MKFHMYDVVGLAKALPEKGLLAGVKGAIVLIYEDADPVHYEVEFCNDQGETLALVTLEENALRAVEGKP